LPSTTTTVSKQLVSKVAGSRSISSQRCRSTSSLPGSSAISAMMLSGQRKIRVHVFYCVLALAVAHLMRRHADRAGLHLSVRELLDQLAASKKLCCSTTTAAKAAPAPNACSPTWPPPNENWPTYSTFTSTRPPADSPRRNRTHWVIHADSRKHLATRHNQTTVARKLPLGPRRAMGRASTCAGDCRRSRRR
jgi:hypothetical protein